MIKQIIFATNYKEFEDKILDYINKQQREDTYVLLRSVTHVDDIVEKCVQLRPSVLVIRDTEDVDLLNIVRDLRMSNLPNLHIVVITHNRLSGDPLLTGLIMYGVYDFINATSFTHATVGELIIHPRTLRDVQNYVPTADKINKTVTFSSSEKGAEKNGAPTEIVSSSQSNGSVADYQSVPHAEDLSEITEETKEDKTLYTESLNNKDASSGLLDIGAKLSYNPLFTNVSMPRVNNNQPTPKITSYETKQLGAKRPSEVKPAINSTIDKPTEQKVDKRTVDTSINSFEPTTAVSKDKVKPESARENIVQREEKLSQVNNVDKVENISKEIPSIVSHDVKGNATNVKVVPNVLPNVKNEQPKANIPTVNKDIVSDSEIKTVTIKHKDRATEKNEEKVVIHTSTLKPTNSVYKWFTDAELDKEVDKLKALLDRVRPTSLKTVDDINSYETLLDAYKKVMLEKQSRGGGK